MRPCFQIEIVTPKKIFLNGLWFGPKKPKRAILWVHGLGSSMFSKLAIVDKLADAQTAVLVFNNRGHDTVANIPREYGSKRKTLQGGAAHEMFTDCVDDIQGAIDFARRQGAKKIFLAGHSTGCQKSVYWASKKNGGRGVRGIILLAPVSDYAAALKGNGRKKLERIAHVAKEMVRQGRGHELLSSSHSTGWSSVDDAQRFLSLYTPDSAETIFSYEQPKKKPRALESLKVPTLVLWAGNDEYADRPAAEIAAWFDKHLKTKHAIVIVPKASHSFRGAESKVAFAIRKFME